MAQAPKRPNTVSMLETPINQSNVYIRPITFKGPEKLYEYTIKHFNINPFNPIIDIYDQKLLMSLREK